MVRVWWETNETEEAERDHNACGGNEKYRLRRPSDRLHIRKPKEGWTEDLRAVPGAHVLDPKKHYRDPVEREHTT